MSTIKEASDLHRSLLTELQASGVLQIEGISKSSVGNDPETDVADATTKTFISDAKGKLAAVLIVSNSVNPFLVERSVSRAMAAKQLLGPDLGRVVLEPLADGMFEGLTYVLWPAQRTLASLRPLRFIQKQTLIPRVRTWLREMTKQTKTLPTADDLTHAYVRPLEAVSGDARYSQETRRLSQIGLSRLGTGQWRPFLSLEHNDLWLGNFLLPANRAARKSNPYGFFVVDWAGAVMRGHPLLDLFRFGLSAGMPARALANEVSVQCHILECQPHDIAPYLIAGLGAIAMNLEHFPEHRYLEMANSVLERMYVVLDLLEQKERWLRP